MPQELEGLSSAALQDLTALASREVPPVSTAYPYGDPYRVRRLHADLTTDYVEEDEEESTVPWYTSQIAGADYTVRVNRGRWYRDSNSGPIAVVELDCGSAEYLDVQVSADDYVVAVLTRVSVDPVSDPMLYPDTVTVTGVAPAALDALSPPGSGNGGYWILGRMGVDGVYATYWYGGDITDYLYIPAASPDVNVKASSTDTTTDYLVNKLSEGTGISISLDPATPGVQTVKISSTAEDVKTKVTAYDTTNGYLADKTVAGDGIVLSVHPSTEAVSQQLKVTMTAPAITWDGQACRPVLRAGNFWYLDSVSFVAGVLTFNNVQTCVPMYDVPGYCDHTGSLSFNASDGSSVAISVVSGLVSGHVGETISGIDVATGNSVTLTVQAGGTVTGFIGSMRVTIPSTGDSQLLRVTAAGRIQS